MYCQRIIHALNVLGLISSVLVRHRARRTQDGDGGPKSERDPTITVRGYICRGQVRVVQINAPRQHIAVG